MNIPNQITISRIVLTVALFVLLGVFASGEWPANRWLLQVAAIVFVLASISDALDGYLARRWKQITQLGRVLDPFADKLLIIGTFVYLCGPLPKTTAETVPFVTAAPWMVIVIAARELFVSVLRAACEAKGVDFSADPWGKIKMIIQVIALTLALAAPAFSALNGLQSLAQILIWITVGVTAISGVSYWRRAWPHLREDATSPQSGAQV